MTKAKKLFRKQSNEEWEEKSSNVLKKYIKKYGGDFILPVDYSESDKNSREIWFKFESEKRDRTCANLLSYKSNFIFMRSGLFLFKTNVEKMKNKRPYEFLGLEVFPKNALVEYSGVYGLIFNGKLVFELKQHINNIIVKFSDATKKVRRCKIRLEGILSKELYQRKEYEEARAKVTGFSRQPGNIAPPIIPSKPKSQQLQDFQLSEQAPTLQFQQPPKTIKSLYSGTGFMFGSKDYVITNWHVIRGTKNIKVKFINGEKINAKVLLKDPQHDIAFIKLERSPKLPPSNLKIGDSSQVRLGDRVFTIGYPAHWVMGEKPKYTSGDVNALSGIKDDPTVFQISVQIQPGNSGGPLFNQNGQVIGITQSSLDPNLAVGAFGTLPQNVNFAIKSNYILNLLPMLPETLISSRGIVVVPTESQYSLGNFIEKIKNNIVLIEATNK